MVDAVELTRVPMVEEWKIAGSRMPWKEPHIQERSDDATETERLLAEVLG